MNSVDPAMRESLYRIWDQLRDDDNVHVIIVTGAGERAFSTGSDLKNTQPPRESFAELMFMRDNPGTFLHRFGLDKPIIAAVNGYAVGGGMELALACDICIASETAKFGITEAKVGSVPGSGAIQRLPALIGTARTLELITMGRRLSGEQAEKIGLVNAVTTPGVVEEEALSWARKVASHSGEALRYLKSGLAGGADMRMAAVWHGLVSDACHQEKNYQDNTDKFKH